MGTELSLERRRLVEYQLELSKSRLLRERSMRPAEEEFLSILFLFVVPCKAESAKPSNAKSNEIYRQTTRSTNKPYKTANSLCIF